VGDLVLTLFIFAFMLGGMSELERRASEEASDHSHLAARFLTFSGTTRGHMGVRTLLGLLTGSRGGLIRRSAHPRAGRFQRRTPGGSLCNPPAILFPQPGRSR
jgi:hypothetical protein